ncbi:terminase TerL endonuclease subunit [Mycobacterium sp. 1482292.6]|uniref:terminase TerL endonuclease subunit n=1 Tax=Mycobacterium sp. 1482292.6 TaxID=1834081 RepID=UPI001E5D1BA0|nr:terminase TerL endonuclease subunit [Mycobacterium sp. 1482292.6]
MPRTAAWALPRGNGKSSLCAAIGLWELMLGGEAATVVVVAVDERQAGIVFGIAARMVELHPELSARVHVYRDRLLVPTRGASLMCLPASPAALEGLNYSLCIADEVGRIDREVWEVVALAQGKRERSVLLGIGTPGPSPDNVLAGVRAYSVGNPEDTSQVYREFSAAGFESHPTDCEHCWELANPALDDFLHRDAMRALQPPKMAESNFRRARLCQFVTGNDEPVLPPGLWVSLATGQPISDGSDVVLAFDGSYSGTDCTVLLAAEVAKRPHVDVLGVWSRPPGAGDEWRVPVLEVEQAIRDACRRYRVREVCCDPYRWQRSLEVLAAEGFPMAEFPQTISRMGAATAEFLTACTNKQITHSGHPVLADHLANAVLSEDGRGGRLTKASRSRHAGRIDAAVCAVMAHSRATHYANKPRKRYASF